MLREMAHVHVRGCCVRRNGDGIACIQQSRLLLELTEVASNRRHGVVGQNSAVATISGVLVRNNPGGGVHAFQSATVELSGSSCIDNEGGDLLVGEHATYVSTARENDVSRGGCKILPGQVGLRASAVQRMEQYSSWPFEWFEMKLNL